MGDTVSGLFKKMQDAQKYVQYAHFFVHIAANKETFFF